VPSRLRQQSSNGAPLAERVQSVLATKQLTLYQVSRQSGALFGRSSPHFIPHNLYHDLRSGSFTPSIHQVFAFARISGYRSRDWLRVFGFDLEDITRLRVQLPWNRTLLLDPSLTDPEEWVTWFRNRSGRTSVPSIAPLAQLLELTPPRRIDSLTKLSRQDFLYAKIGREDAYAFPDLVPGSVVRVQTVDGESLPLPRNNKISDRIFLVEHNQGVCCCRVRAVEKGVIVPVSTQLSYAQMEFEHPREARILGVVDLEIRPLLDTEEPIVPKDLARRWKPRPLLMEGRLGQVLRRARSNMNLSLRQASAMSRLLGEILKDQRYAVSSSSLYEYEALHTPPRDFHKIVTLCSLYGVPFLSFLQTMGVVPEQDGEESIPDHLIPRRGITILAEDTTEDQTIPVGFLEQLLDECKEIPFFLRDSIGHFCHAASVSLDDFFWIGSQREALHPYLANGLVAVVNRRRRTAVHFTSRPVWAQPMYIIAKRDETYLAASCGIENGTLVIHPYTSDFHRPTQFRQHQDAEVVGQIVAVARKI
jgi:transcriptional regulator with XRE-family HTH domain